MRKITMMAAALVLFAASAQAEDPSFYQFPIAPALEKAKGELRGGVRFYFGDAPTPEVRGVLEKEYQVHKRSGVPSQNIGDNGAFTPLSEGAENARKACERSFVAVMQVMEKRALRRRGNAVVGIISYYKGRDFPASATEYTCYSDGVRAGVMLRGDIVKVE